ncbi:hypothetical protein BK133_29240 [Paenibacillus sp. FSL H8-0548]|uniref:hypothetical protein n=1 Tax=Paenibacillus sp. FSL H8-0548 TaxID=1920422 RepID=UPI00096E399B|nr:hypothetical protein [Paenibacillus sp. FSL H8-0548]OMF20418.1 hypothetical protein BK133_29240 [Paenibacillus sp. FSL H8-0548]
MKIYVIQSFNEDGMENIYVGADEEKALSLKAEDFEHCDALFVEIWEDGAKTDDFRLVESSEDEEDDEEETSEEK